MNDIAFNPERIKNLLDMLKPAVEEMDNRDQAFKTRAGTDWEGELKGYAPVQGDGKIDGHPWYFRARWSNWSLSIAEDPNGNAIDVRWDRAPGWYYEGDYGNVFAEASWMSYEDAWIIIEACFELYREGKGYTDGREKEGE